jgi:hypothetical protein
MNVLRAPQGITVYVMRLLWRGFQTPGKRTWVAAIKLVVGAAVLLLKSTATAVGKALGLVGAAAAFIVMVLDVNALSPNLTIVEFVTTTRANARPVLFTLLTAWICLYFVQLFVLARRGQIDGISARKAARKAARHEAAHALVGVVLGLPVDGARVYYVGSGVGTGGWVTTDAPSRINDTGGLYDLLVRTIAMDVAGGAAVCSNREAASLAFLNEACNRIDLEHAQVLSWTCASVEPRQVALQTVTSAVVREIRTEPWKRAIEAAADVLLRNVNSTVPAAAFIEIARKFNLALPEVEAIAEAGSPQSQQAGCDSCRPGRIAASATEGGRGYSQSD